MKEHEWILLIVFGLALAALGAWLPESEFGYGILASLASGSGVALVSIASACLGRLPTNATAGDDPGMH